MGGLLIKSLHYFSSSQLTCNFRSTVVPVWPSWTFLGLSSKQESGHIASQFIPISNHTGNQGNPGQYILGIEYTFIEDPLFRLLWPLIIHDITCLYHLSMSAKRTAQKDQEKRTHTHTHIRHGNGSSTPPIRITSTSWTAMFQRGTLQLRSTSSELGPATEKRSSRDGELFSEPGRSIYNYMIVYGWVVSCSSGFVTCC